MVAALSTALRGQRGCNPVDNDDTTRHSSGRSVRVLAFHLRRAYGQVGFPRFAASSFGRISSSGAPAKMDLRITPSRKATARLRPLLQTCLLAPRKYSSKLETFSWVTSCPDVGEKPGPSLATTRRQEDGVSRLTTVTDSSQFSPRIDNKRQPCGCSKNLRTLLHIYCTAL